MEPLRQGASVEMQSHAPAIDLAALVTCLCDVLQDSEARAPHEQLLSFDASGGALQINTSAALRRLTKAQGWSALQQAQKTGFLRDVAVPRSPSDAKIGGRVVHGSEPALRDQLAALTATLDDDLQRLCDHAGLALGSLPVQPRPALEALARRIGGASLAPLDAATRLCRVRFENPERSAQDRSDDVGRLISATEEIEGGDRFDKLAQALRRRMEQQDMLAKEVESVLAYHRQLYETPGSQVARFLSFLDDEALSRVRLAVSFNIMRTVADEAASRTAAADSADFALLAEYVRRAQALYQAATDPSAPELRVDLSRHFGARAEFSLGDELSKVLFYGCLPVFCTSTTQLFEARRASRDSAVPSVAREVSYRFKVNGKNPISQEPAYLGRLQRLRGALQDDTLEQPTRRLAELLFLAVVIPAPAPPADFTVQTEIARRLETLSAGGRPAALALLDELEARAHTVERIAAGLLKVLRTRGVALTQSLTRRTWSYYLCVQRGIVDWQRALTEVEDPLLKAEPGTAEQIPWFRNLQVTEGQPLTGSLLSVRVTVRLAERSLCQQDDALVECSVQRRLSAAVLQVLWRPYGETRTGPTTSSFGALQSDAESWAFPRRVEILYDPRTLQPRHPGMALDESKEQAFAAYRTAFTVLVYCALFVLLRRLKESQPAQELTVLMLRLQQGGREDGPLAASQSLYAASQAIEHALGRDFTVHNQGLVDPGTRGRARSGTDQYRLRGTFTALLSAFPLALAAPRPPSIDCIGVVTFVSRPCDLNPEAKDPAQDGHVFLGRTYQARAFAGASSGYEVRPDQNVIEVDFGQDAFDKPKVVLERISRLYAQGCRHIIYLAHRYGGRHLGRSALRHRHHESPAFLSQVATRFPDLVLYPMVRDVFPATRLRQRGRDEDVYEVLRPGEHIDDYVRDTQDLRSGLLPIYTLATLHVVGEESSRLQSGFATYYLLHDQELRNLEWVARAYANLTVPESTVRDDIIAVLRALHFIEAERGAVVVRGRPYVQPVLDPYGWMSPSSVGGAGEILVRKSRRRAGSVSLSLPAVLARVAGVLHAQRRRP